jgi:hypothetical protein
VSAPIKIDPVTREYRMDMQLHLYRRAHLEDPAYRYLIPVCQESEMYPDRHPRNNVSINQLSGQGFCDRCASCDVADRRARRTAQGATR